MSTASPTADTPPVTVSEPINTRYEYEMGYHRALVEKSGGTSWAVTIISPLLNGTEALYYDDEALAQDGAKTYVKGVYNAEMSVRQTFYSAYQKASGRESAPTTPGPQWTPPVTPATLVTLSPAVGPVAGGTVLTLTGSGLSGATAATLGGVPATDVTIVDDATITMTTPAAAATGTVDLVLTDDSGAVTMAAAFTYQ